MEIARYDPYHRVFEAPSSDTKLWRYLTFTKFVSMLEFRALHFSRADLLGDPFEGSASQPVIAAREFAKLEDGSIVPASDPRAAVAGPSWAEIAARARGAVYVSCWNESEIESDALWSKYVSADAGVAVRTTFGRLTKALGPEMPPPETPEREATSATAIHIGRVSYVDYSTAIWPVGNAFWPFLHKRASFAHESEVRAVLMDFDAVATATPGSPGRSIAIDLDELLETVFVSPAAPSWFADVVSAVVARYGLGVTVHQSSLAIEPTF